MTAPARASTFTYLGCAVDVGSHSIRCTYRSDEDEFEEVATFDDTVDLEGPGIEAAASLYALLAGLSYYKTGAARTVDLGRLGAGPATRSLLAAAIVDGLAEFAYRLELDLSDVELVGGTAPVPLDAAVATAGPLVPFGGGIDSIVTATAAAASPGAALFIMGPQDDPFAAIERPAARTALPIVRCARSIDDQLRSGAAPGWFNGHVPVTAIVSALAIVAAVAQRRSSVVMSNERSASVPNLVAHGRGVNHQWSKSLGCEDLLRASLAELVPGGPSYASALRDRSELWVASRFAELDGYLDSFMSCNRAFRQDPSARATTWCGECDKCLFTNLVLAPFVPRERLASVFAGREPIADPGRVGALEVLAGIVDNPKPFECVGDADECATALVATAARDDRADLPHLRALAARCSGATPLDELLEPDGLTHSTVLGAARDLV